MKILIDQNNNPIGGKWSFDEENRKKLPKNFIAPALPKFTADKIDLEVFNLVNLNFKDHPGHTSDYWLPTDRKNSYNWLKSFVLERLSNFGPFEDALSEKHDFINHSVLTPFLNTGLLTPDEIIIAVINEAKKQQYPINSVEGFIRQIIGWREFIRGIYQNYSEIQDTSNFWNHHRKLNDKWYTGDTGIAPLDHVIKKASKIGYAHHIERLMVVGSLMLLLEVHPQEAHRWFMEMFIDSSDWVMGPNVYGMTLHSDGGIFATKPYFCGSNYYKKMGDFKGGEWEIAVDGLYWMFIEKNKSFFNKNPRTSFMSKNLEKISKERKEQMFQAAEAIKKLLTEPI
jgi:deoxyribodipyrimidine photolyase-related protein